jgi:MFS family permease
MSEPRLLSVGALNFALSFAAGGMVLTTLALLVHHRGLSLFGRSEQGTAGLLMGWMTIVDAVTTPMMGRIGDRLRAHGKVATAGIALLVPGLLFVGLSPGRAGVLVGLALMGVGAAGLGPSLLVMVGELVARERRGTATGLLQLCGDIGGMLGPLIGTALFAGHTALPYVGTAALVATFVPVGVYLSVVERRLAKERAAPVLT